MQASIPGKGNSDPLQYFFFLFPHSLFIRASQVALVVKNPLASAQDLRDACSIPGLGRSPGDGHGNPLQYSCLENPMDRGVWQATVRGVAKSGTRLSNQHFHFPRAPLLGSSNRPHQNVDPFPNKRSVYRTYRCTREKFKLH